VLQLNFLFRYRLWYILVLYGYQSALALTLRLAHRFPLCNRLDLARPILAVGAMFSVFGLTEHPLVKLLIA